MKKRFASIVSALALCAAGTCVSAAAPTLYGLLAHCDSWDKNTSNAGIYSFTPEENIVFTKEMATATMATAAYADGMLSGYNTVSFWGSVQATYRLYDCDSGELVQTKTYSGQQYEAISMAYNYADDTIYGIFVNAAGSGTRLCRVDMLTGAPSEIAALTSTIIPYAMAFDNNGTLYCICDDAKLYTLNLDNAAITAVGNTGLSPKYSQSMFFNEESGKFYWAYMDADLNKATPTAFYEIDPKTAKATLVGNYEATTQIVALYGPHKANADAPQAPTDAKLTYIANGSTGAKLEFTAPTKANNGSTLSGELKVQLVIDHAPIADAPATVMPGAKYEYPFTFTSTGSHKVEILIVNEGGASERVRINTYAGEDAPGAVNNLNLQLDGLNATLSWEAPTTGASGGWFDASNLGYKIVRLPDNKVVAELYKSTNYSETIPEHIGMWHYEVTPIGNKTGKASRSNKVLHGTSMQVPYSESFDTDASMDLFTTEDSNGDGYNWVWENDHAVNNAPFEGNLPCADWLITPPITLSNDWVYKMTFKAATFSSVYSEEINLGFGTEATGSSMEIIGSYITDKSSYQTYESLVEVSENGNYYLGIQHSTPTGRMRAELKIDDITLTPFISSDAPGRSTNVKAQQNSDNSLAATISFTAPAKSIRGNNLTAISKIEIIVNGTVAETLTDITPGTAISKAVKLTQGKNIIKLLAYNEIGRGLEVEIEVFGGTDIPGVVKNLRYKWDQSDSSNPDGKAILMWDAPDLTGINGLPLKESDITYSLMMPGFGDQFLDSETGIKTTEKLISATYTKGTLTRRGIKAVTAGGNGTPVVIYLSLGPAEKLDAADSFKAGSPAYGTYSVSTRSGAAAWAMFNDNPNGRQSQDADNGFAMCRIDPATDAESGVGVLTSPAFDFSKQATPYLHIWVLHSTSAAEGTTLSFEATTNACDYSTVGETIAINDGTDGWKQHHISLASLAGARKAMIAFVANITDKNSAVAIDNYAIDYTSSIGEIGVESDADVTISAEAGSVIVTGAAGKTALVFTTDGRTVCSKYLATGTETIDLTSGIYIVKVASKIVKVAVR